jgi:hypothetical protein
MTGRSTTCFQRHKTVTVRKKENVKERAQGTIPVSTVLEISSVFTKYKGPIKERKKNISAGNFMASPVRLL